MADDFKALLEEQKRTTRALMSAEERAEEDFEEDLEEIIEEIYELFPILNEKKIFSMVFWSNFHK